MKSPIKKHLGLFIALSSILTVFAGCKNKTNQSEEGEKQKTPEQQISDEELLKAINSSNPEVNVNVLNESEYEHLSNFQEVSELEDVDINYQTYASSSILDMPIDEEIYVVFNTDAKTTFAPSPSLFTNIVNANSELQTIQVKDRGGKDILRSNSSILSANGTKLKVSGESSFEYGEVYQISINDADFLCFENKDPSIRTLTIEIEDSPSEKLKGSLNENERKSSIKNIDLDKMSNKRVYQENGNYSFDYGGVVSLEKGDIFYATIEGKENDKLDFYGLVESVEPLEGITRVTYDSVSIDQVYNQFHLRDVKKVDLNEAEILVTEDSAKAQFKSSSLALGVARTAASLVENDVNEITNIFSKFSINFSINIKDNTLSMKFTAGVNGYKLKDNLFLSINFAYEKITTYTVDFDVSISYSWIFPSGVDYKIKCVEDTTEIFSLKGVLTVSFDPETPVPEKDITKTIANEISKIKSLDEEDRKTSTMTAFDKDTSLKPATSGSKTTWPIVVADLYYLAPITMRFRADFYIDTGFQAMLNFAHETHSTKVNFCFSNMGGSQTDVSNTIDKTSNWEVAFVGTLYFEIGFRVSYSFSILGLYDYLKAEAYAEFYINSSCQGMLMASITEHSKESDFTGYLGIDASLTAGMRVGLDFKALFVSENLSKTLWITTLVRFKLSNSLEHVSERAQNAIEMTKLTMPLDETNVLWYEVFNNLTMVLEEKKFKADDQFKIIAGPLVPSSIENLFSDYTFQYSIENDPENKVEVSDSGVIHIKDDMLLDINFTLKIHVSNWCGSVSDREIPVHFHNEKGREVYIVVGDYIAKTDEPVYTLLSEKLPGEKIILPEGPKYEGFFFYDYGIYDGGELQSGAYFDLIHPLEVNSYRPGDVYVIPEGKGKIIFQCFYTVAEKYSVNFYDGNNNLVYVDEVYEGEDATEPYPAIRDRFMDKSKYTFVGWNCKFNNVKKNIDVYGIYIGIEEVR